MNPIQILVFVCRALHARKNIIMHIIQKESFVGCSPNTLWTKFTWHVSKGLIMKVQTLAELRMRGAAN